MISYRIPLRGLKLSQNATYAGIHWAKRKQIKDSWLSVAAGFCRPVEQPESYPVSIRYRFLFGSRPLDTLNCATMAKMAEDSLRTIGVLKDDDPRYVTEAIINVVAIPREKKKKGAAASGQQANAEDKDWLEIEINSIKLP